MYLKKNKVKGLYKVLIIKPHPSYAYHLMDEGGRCKKKSMLRYY